MDVTTKRCSKCQITKGRDQFYRAGGYCKDCSKALSHQQVVSGYNRRRHEAKKVSRAKDIRRCARCKQSLAKSEFVLVARGLSNNCKSCIATVQEQLNTKLPPHKRAKHKRQPGEPRKPRKPPDKIGQLAGVLFSNIKKRCALTNSALEVDRAYIVKLVREFCASSFFSLETYSPFKPSIDRTDNARGYTQDNIKVVWMIENYAKNRFTEGDVIEFCQRKLGLL